MKTAWLVVNHYINSQKFEELYTWFMHAAQTHGLHLIQKTNASLLPFLNQEGDVHLFEDASPAAPNPDFVIFWDKDVRLAGMLELLGIPVFNRSAAIAACDDKALTYLTLASHHIPMPKTFFSPLTFSPIGYSDYSFVTGIGNVLSYPFIIKECFGSFGEQVHLAQNRMHALQIIQSMANRPFLMQEFISDSIGRDIRLQVVGDKVIASMLRCNSSDFRANITIGGQMQTYEPTEEQSALALRVCRLLQLDFAGVDLLFGKDDTPVLCEVNSNAHFKNIFDCTGINAADAILEYCLKNYKIRKRSLS